MEYKKQSRQKFVYNLEFPSYCNELSIFGYTFIRTDNYEDQLKHLQHLSNMISEFQIETNTGIHAVTAIVEIPKNEEQSALDWRSPQTALQDVLFLLSFFTGRDLFITDDLSHGPLVADPRLYQWGGVLRASLPYKGRRVRDEKIVETEEISDDGNVEIINIDLYPETYDIGFEEELNRINDLIRDEGWRKKYRNGYFLYLAQAAFKRQAIEESFTKCWTIWEHLFALLASSWLEDREIWRFPSKQKIAYLLVEYDLKNEIETDGFKHIDELVVARNRLIHYGRFPESGISDDEAALFIRLTEFIIAKILGLSPSNLFNTIEKLEEFLSATKK